MGMKQLELVNIKRMSEIPSEDDISLKVSLETNKD